MSAIDTKFYQRKKQNFLYGSIGVLLFVCVSTGALYWYNLHIQDKVLESQEKLDQIENSLAELQNEKDLRVYKTYSSNSDFLHRKSCNSKIVSFITHLKKNMGKYGLNTSGFSYDGTNITTDLSAPSAPESLSYQKIQRFLGQYENEATALFTPQFVSSFAGYDRINFTQSFTLNDRFYEECKSQ